MEAASFPDWRRIGRTIGKKLRDGLNPHPVAPGPTQEERRAQRLRDGFKGFVYFDTFEEVEAWKFEDVDPVQQPNQPLLSRNSSNVYNEDGPKTKLILCHDYQGGYHDYESVRPDLLDSAMQLASITDAYNFDGWLINVEQDAPEAYRDWSQLLIEFILQLRLDIGAHKKVLWYDALTTDGDVYYQNGLTTLNRQYAEAADGLFTNYRWTDKKLAESKLLATGAGIPNENIFFGIDLWAQNTNMPGPPRVTYPSKGGGGTNTGFVGFPTLNVICKSLRKLKAMKTLSPDGFSTAAFAPAWTFEHFPTSRPSCASGRGPSVAQQVDESLWTGASLPEELFCDCHGRKPHHTAFYRDNPIVRFAQEYPTGSSSFFESTFKQAFWEKPQTNQVLPALSSQDPSPNLIPLSMQDWEEIHEGPMARVLYGKLNSNTQVADHITSLIVFTKMAGCWEEGEDQFVNCGAAGKTPRQVAKRLRLYKLDMPADGSLEATVEARNNTRLQCGFYVAYGNPDGQPLEYTDHAMPLPGLSPGSFISFPIQNSKQRLVEFGVFLEGGPDQSQPMALLDINSIVIKPLKAREVEALETTFTIRDIRLVKKVRGSQTDKRNAWRWTKKTELQGQLWPVGMPWSQTTGPFSSFTVHVGRSKVIAEAFCTECSLKPEEVEALDENVGVQVVGNLFGGGHVRSTLCLFHTADLVNAANGV
ncbi:MAG: hypothetical protein Q9213_001081 [Squamulea squamosa]